MEPRWFFPHASVQHIHSKPSKAIAIIIRQIDKIYEEINPMFTLLAQSD